jgi:ABC-type multidrug transport system fused ATPase/permease subunit
MDHGGLMHLPQTPLLLKGSVRHNVDPFNRQTDARLQQVGG